MYRLSDELPHVNLALSLHAPNQEVRSVIVPAARAHHIDKLMEAIDYHIAKNSMQPITKETFENAKGLNQGALMFSEQNDENDMALSNVDKPGGTRRGRISGVMIEYILIRDINDKDEHALELAKLLMPRRDNILLNLIPYNPTDVAEEYLPPFEEQVNRFYTICSSPPYSIYTRVRQEKGQDIAGACGQLALVRGNNTGGDKSGPVDLEDTAMPRSRSAKSKSNKVVADSSRSRNSSEESGGASSSTAGLHTSKGATLLEEVLRGYEVYSFNPVCDNSFWRQRALRIRLALLANMLVPVGLTAMDWFARKSTV